MSITKPSDEVMFKLLKDSIEYDLSIVKFTNKEKKPSKRFREYRFTTKERT